MRGLFLFQQADVSGLGIVFIILVFVALFFLIRWALNSGKKENNEGNSVYDRNALPETDLATSYAGLGEYGGGYPRPQEREYDTQERASDEDDDEDEEFFDDEDGDDYEDDDEDIILYDDDQLQEDPGPDSDQQAAQYMGAGAEETVELEDPALDTAETVDETPVQSTADVLPFATSTAFDEPQSAEDEADLIVDESEPEAEATDLESEIAAEASHEYVEPAAEVFEPEAAESATEEDVSSIFEEPAAEETTSFTEVVEAPAVEVETSADDLTTDFSDQEVPSFEEEEIEPAPASFETAEPTSSSAPEETSSYEAPASEPSSASSETSSDTSSESDDQ